MLSLGSIPAMQFKKWHDETGPIYKVRMGKQTWVMISDPYLAHEIFVKNGANTSSRPYHRFNCDIYARNSRCDYLAKKGDIHDTKPHHT